MPWVRAKLKGQTVFAKSDDAGEFVVDGGRVEIRYKANDGRAYRAGARNLKRADSDILPDDACGSAESVDSRATAKGGKKAKKKKSAGPPPPEAPPAGEAIAFTDGACSGNPGPAGLGLVVLTAETRIERYEYLGKGTNNVAELSAVVRAVEELPPGMPATVYTDSTYTIGVAVKGWKAKANQELVAELKRVLSKHGSVKLAYVKGHAGIPLNELADELARRAVTERGDGRTESPVEG